MSFNDSIAVVIVWLLIIFVITGPLIGWSRHREDGNSVDTGGNGEMILARLSRAMNELTALKAQNEELRSLLQNYLPIDVKPLDEKSSLLSSTSANSKSDKLSNTPSQEYELTRRRLETNVNELWHFLRTKTNSSVMKFVNELNIIYYMIWVRVLNFIYFISVNKISVF